MVDPYGSAELRCTRSYAFLPSGSFTASARIWKNHGFEAESGMWPRLLHFQMRFPVGVTSSAIPSSTVASRGPPYGWRLTWLRGLAPRIRKFPSGSALNSWKSLITSGILIVPTWRPSSLWTWKGLEAELSSSGWRMAQATRLRGSRVALIAWAGDRIHHTGTPWSSKIAM